MAVFSPLGRTSAPSGFTAPGPQARAAPQALQVPAHCVLVLLDGTAAAVNAAWRGALVARDRGLALHLLTLLPVPQPPAAALAGSEALAAELRQHFGLAVSAQVLPGSLPCEGVQAARHAALLVLPAAGDRPFGRWLEATRVLRLLRRSGRPLLVVRRPAVASYRGVLVAVALDTGTERLVAAARLLSRDPRMQVLHVLPTDHEETLRLADVPEPVIQRERGRNADAARELLARRVSAAGADRDGAQAVIAFGHLASRVLERAEAHRTELVVLGKRLRPGWAEWLRSSLVRRLLADGEADLLVLPWGEERSP